MKEKYIVYYHYAVKTATGFRTKLAETTASAYSTAHASYIVRERLRKKGRTDYGIDGTMTLAEEKKLNSSYFWDL